jgi:hypothetical protein
MAIDDLDHRHESLQEQDYHNDNDEAKEYRDPPERDLFGCISNWHR